jgi:mannitol/fructose-specific phosphotransferase system IIA component (Ntr-type)
MDLNDFLGPNPIIVDLQAEDRWEAIDEMLDHLIAHQKIKQQDRDPIADAVKKREKSMTTGIGFGIGIPHASTDLVSEAIGIVGRSRSGINFETLHSKPVRLVLLFLVPQGQFQKHLAVLANIAKLLPKIHRDFGTDI